MAAGSGTKLDTLFWELEVRMARAQAEQEARVAGVAAGSAFDEGFDAGDKGRKGAEEFVKSLSRDLQARREDIKKEAVAGLITPAEAAAAGRAASKSFVEELRGGLHALRERGVINDSDLPDLLVKGGEALRVQRLEAERLAHQLNGTSAVYDKLSRSVYQQAYAMDAARKPTSVYANLSRQVYVEAYRMNESFNAVVKTTNNVGGGLRRIREPLTSLATSAIGARSNVGALVSQLALLGIGATATLAITAGIAAIAFAYSKITEEARKARAEIDRVIEGLQQQIDVEFRASRAGQQAAANAALLEEIRAQERLDKARAGTKVIDETGQEHVIISQAAITKAEAELREAQARTIRAEKNIQEAAASAEEKRAAALGRALQAGKASNEMTAEATKLTKAYNEELTRLLSSGATDDITLARIATLRSMIDNLTAADREAERAATRAQREADKIRAKIPGSIAAPDFVTGEEISDQARRALAQATASAVDDLTIELEDLRKKFGAAAAAGNSYAKELLQIKEIELGLVRSGESFQFRLERYEELFNLSGNAIRLVSQLNTERDNLEANLKGAKTDAERRAIKQRIAEIDERIAKAADEAADANERAAKAGQDLDISTKDIAGGIASAANAAFGLASAFLGVDNNVTRALGSIGQLAGGVEAALSATSKLAMIGGIGQAIGGGLALAASLFGESPEERARTERIRENTEALRKLTDRVGTLAQVGASGSNLAIASAIFGDAGLDERAVNRRALALVNRSQGSVTLGQAQEIERRKALDEAIKRNGLSTAEFEEILNGLGITLDRNKLSAKDFEAAMNAVNEAAIVKFGSSFAGQMEQFNAAINLFPDLQDPIKQFEAFRKALERIKGGGGILGDLLKDFDLTTTEGLEAARRAIQELFRQLEAGTLTAAQLGGLSPSEFLEAILKVQDFIDAAAEAGPAGTGGFNVSREITEVTGSRIGGLLTTANVYLAEISASNKAMLAALTGQSYPLVGAPSVPVFGGSGAGTNITFQSGSLVVNLHGSIPNPEDTGIRVGQAIIAEIDRGLGRRAAFKRRAAGDVTLN